MRVFPKVDDRHVLTPELIQQIEEAHGMEIQMTKKDLAESWLGCLFVLNSVSGIDEVILHMPLGIHVLSVFMASPAYEAQLMDLIKKMKEYSVNTQTKMGLLFHLQTEQDIFENMGGMEYIQKLLAMIKGTPMYFLFENSIASCNSCPNGHIPMFNIIQEVPADPQIRVCLDVCHLKSAENAVRHEAHIAQDVLDRIYSIHFSATLNGDGFWDKKTHGRKHSSVQEVLDEMDYLSMHGVNLDPLVIVAEINEDDYCLRPDLLEELGYLKEAQKLLEQ